MSHVKKAQAYTHWPTGCPNRARMKDPSLHEWHEPSKSYKWRLGPIKPAFLDKSPQKGQSTTSLLIIKASPSPCKNDLIVMGALSLLLNRVFYTLRFAAPIQELGNRLARKILIESPYLSIFLYLRLEKNVCVKLWCLTGLDTTR